MNYPMKNPIYLKQVCTFQSNQIKLENPKSLLLLKRFIVVLLTTLNARKPNLRLKHISRILLILISTTTNLPTYTTSTSRLTKDKDIFIMKPDKETGVVILDRKLYDNAIQEIISDTFKFEKLNEDPALKREASLNVFYVS